MSVVFKAVLYGLCVCLCVHVRAPARVCLCARGSGARIAPQRTTHCASKGKTLGSVVFGIRVASLVCMFLMRKSQLLSLFFSNDNTVLVPISHPRSCSLCQ